MKNIFQPNIDILLKKIQGVFIKGSYCYYSDKLSFKSFFFVYVLKQQLTQSIYCRQNKVALCTYPTSNQQQHCPQRCLMRGRVYAIARAAYRNITLVHVFADVISPFMCINFTFLVCMNDHNCPLLCYVNVTYSNSTGNNNKPSNNCFYR